MHHFLYQKASGDQERKLKEDGNAFIAIGEEAIYENLDEGETEILNQVIRFYRSSIIDKNLPRELGYTRVWLQKQNRTKLVADATVSSDLVAVLRQFDSVYKTHFWPVHSKHNETTISKHIDHIIQLESVVISKVAMLAQNEWPSGRKVRVDLTAYANYAGAYTVTRPIFNIILSTLDPDSPGTGFIETIFHEGSHLLFRFGSPIRDRIYDRAEELEVKFPRNLWHAWLFYTCGKVVQEEYAKLGIEHPLVMDEKNIFSSYNTEEFRVTLDQYMLKEMSFEATLDSLIIQTSK